MEQPQLSWITSFIWGIAWGRPHRPGTGVSGSGAVVEAELELLSAILASFNDLFGGIDWDDKDRIQHLIVNDVPRLVAADPAYQHAQANADMQNARIEHNAALERVMRSLLKDQVGFYKIWADDPAFRKWLSDSVFEMTYRRSAPAA